MHCKSWCLQMFYHIDPPTPLDLQMKEISSSSVIVTVFPPVSSISMWEVCGMSYVVETVENCNRQEQDWFVCSNLNLYQETYIFSVYGILEATGTRNNFNAISKYSSDINNLGSCMFQLRCLMYVWFCIFLYYSTVICL